ncbi:MAG: hypothetical protein K2Y21_04050 [Phycisphaerales bacterium]|nr:hypothetical protein [Phycisphaerales bacterium]
MDLFRSKRVLALAAAAVCGVGFAGQADAAPTLLYSTSFDTPAAVPEWSSNYWRVEEHGQFGIFNGRYSQGWTALSLNIPNLGPASGPTGAGTYAVNRFTVVFDLFIIDSWDAANSYGGFDHFLVSANGQQVIDWGFTNTGGQQRNPLTPSRSGTDLGFSPTAPDSIYRNVTLTFDLAPGQNLFLKFYDQNLGGVSDEGWGIDNVSVYGEALRVPTPSVAMGLTAGLSLLGRRRRVK